jgi:predicted nuclease with TOPRIM domain
MVYPEEREGRVKDANKKLRSDLKREKNKVKKLEQDLASLQRAFDKSCQYINEKLSNKKVEDIIDLVNNFKYKETEKGRKKQEVKQNENVMLKKCPECNTIKGEGYAIINFAKSKVLSCKCGFRKRVGEGERNEGS